MWFWRWVFGPSLFWDLAWVGRDRTRPPNDHWRGGWVLRDLSPEVASGVTSRDVPSQHTQEHVGGPRGVMFGLGLVCQSVRGRRGVHPRGAGSVLGGLGVWFWLTDVSNDQELVWTPNDLLGRAGPNRA